ncbi:MAG: hypothetical protein HXS53_05080 [Theionarchaea archaeon]|nr:hypothetical protein [Theionarchaea archaeon]
MEEIMSNPRFILELHGEKTSIHTTFYPDEPVRIVHDTRGYAHGSMDEHSRIPQAFTIPLHYRCS